MLEGEQIYSPNPRPPEGVVLVVLVAAKGWASKILEDRQVKDSFAEGGGVRLPGRGVGQGAPVSASTAVHLR